MRHRVQRLGRKDGFIADVSPVVFAACRELRGKLAAALVAESGAFAGRVRIVILVRHATTTTRFACVLAGRAYFLASEAP